MGYFSSLAAGDAAERHEDGADFALDVNAIDGTSVVSEHSEPPAEQFDDEALQDAAAKAAPAVLAMLNDQNPDDDENGAEAQPDAVSATDDDAQAAEDQKRKEHEEAEAQRLAEWEAKQAEKKAAEEKAIQEANAMSPQERAIAAVKRLGDQSEAITRHNMMMCVTEHVQTLCHEDPAFAKLVMHPRKSMLNCFKHINKKAYEAAKLEMEARGIRATPDNPYASAVAQDVCYKWAEEYFRDPDAEEDKSEEEEFVPKPYYGGSSKTKKKASAKPKKAVDKKPVAKAAEKPADSGAEQMTLDLSGLEQKAS